MIKPLKIFLPLCAVYSLLMIPFVWAQSPSEEKLQELLALPYLQGYDPPTETRGLITHDKSAAYDGYNLLTSGHAPEAVLLDMEGNILHSWRYEMSRLKDFGPDDEWSKYWTNTYLFPNGDLLALFTSHGLIKIDKDSNLLWARKDYFHHDFSLDAEGNIYVLSWDNRPMKDGKVICDNLICILNSEGKLKKRISFFGLFKKFSDQSYFKNLLKKVATGEAYSFNKLAIPRSDAEGDIFHANTIEILDGKLESQSPAFKKGNVLICLRHSGIIAIVDPQKEEIVWILKPGLWNIGQHDSALLPSGHILLFENFYTLSRSRVVEFDPMSEKIIWEYTDSKFFSSVGGLNERLPNGNTLITQTTAGRVFEVTPERKIVWEYINPYDKLQDNNRETIAILPRAVRIPKNFPLGWLKPSSE